MNTSVARLLRLEFLLARLLRYGTWLASAVTTLGLTLALIEGLARAHDSASLSSTRIITSGIACFILLPVCRVILMLIVFVRERDYRFIVITALVLMTIFVGFAIGAHTKPARTRMVDQKNQPRPRS